MKDITKQEYSEWLEAALKDLVEFEPQTIGIVTIQKDGTTGTQYFRADNRDRAVMIEAILIDWLSALVEVNVDYLRELLNEEDEE